MNKNKNIKRIISMTLAFGIISAVEPSKYLDLLTTKAYAASTVYAITDLSVSGEDLYKDSSCDDEDVIPFSTTTSKYYTETNDSGIYINADTQSGYNVTIYKGSSKTPLRPGNRIHVESGTTTTFHVKATDSNDDKVIEYTISLKQTSRSSSSYRSSSSSSSDDDVYLNDITLSDGEISFSKSKKTYDINVGEYVDEIRIKADPESDDDTVEIDGDTVDEDDKYRKVVSLNKGQNKFKITVEDDDDNERTYILNINRGNEVSSNSNATDNSQDEIYLDDLLVDNGSGYVAFNFRPKATTYNMDVKESCDSIIIKGTPEEEDNIVRVNGDKVDSRYRKEVNLVNGKNVIKVKVSNENDYDDDDDDYEERIYTLTVYRGTSQGSANSVTSVNNSNIKASQWVWGNGKWQYNDALGNPLRSIWFFDKSYGAWYYLDAAGDMRTGWIQDASGKYYYLYPSGIMAYNVTIDGYKLGSDGAWTK